MNKNEWIDLAASLVALGLKIKNIAETTPGNDVDLSSLEIRKSFDDKVRDRGEDPAEIDRLISGT